MIRECYFLLRRAARPFLHPPKPPPPRPLLGAGASVGPLRPALPTLTKVLACFVVGGTLLLPATPPERHHPLRLLPNAVASFGALPLPLPGETYVPWAMLAPPSGSLPVARDEGVGWRAAPPEPRPVAEPAAALLFAVAMLAFAAALLLTRLPNAEENHR